MDLFLLACGVSPNGTRRIFRGLAVGSLSHGDQYGVVGAILYLLHSQPGNRCTP